VEERVEGVLLTFVDIHELRQNREVLQKDANFISAILDAARDLLVVVLDREGHIVHFNRVCQELTGYSLEEVRGKCVWDFLLAPEETQTVKATFREVAAGAPNQLENYWIGKDGRRLLISWSNSALRSEGAVESVISTGVNVTERQEARERAQQSEATVQEVMDSSITEKKKNEKTRLEYQDQLQKLSGALISAQEAGNRAVARELHDVFSQELAALGMEIAALKEVKSKTELTARLSAVAQKIGRLAENIHHTSRKLHPSILEDLGLAAALRQERESFEEVSGIPTHLTVKKVKGKLPAEVSLCLYRVAQECLRNIQKHAPSADTVHMTLTGSPEGVTLTVQDAGDGFEPDQTLRKGGLGLISMEERVRLLRGRLTVESRAGEGTTVTAFVPITEEERV
jgi:PAS domain S-box-containing protein